MFPELFAIDTLRIDLNIGSINSWKLPRAEKMRGKLYSESYEEDRNYIFLFRVKDNEHSFVWSNEFLRQIMIKSFCLPPTVIGTLLMKWIV